MPDARLAILAGLGIGIALASAPGPIQAVLLAESVRGGVARGLQVWAGAAFTFGLALVALALGLSLVAPSDLALRILMVAGGTYLLLLAVDGFRSTHEPERAASPRRALPPAVLGSLAVLLNPGGWLFLAAVASPLFASASQVGGRLTALLSALALIAGLAAGDIAVVLIGGVGIRQAHGRIRTRVRQGLAALLALLALWLLAAGLAP